jgi:type IX secretion system PorP/SprF family membrane protein
MEMKLRTNKFKYILMLLLTTLGFTNEAIAQQDAQYTQYMYNPMNVNPGYAGTRGSLSVFGMHRTQWVGLQGAPVTNVLSLHTPIGDSRLGIGFSIVNDKIGPSDENTLSVDLAYRIPMNEKSTLSFGIKGAANLLNVDYTKLDIYDSTDSQFQNNIDNRFSPNVGAGAFWYSDKHYLGLSVPNFLETRHYDANNTSSLAKERLHYYVMGGYVFNLSESLKFKPAVLSKFVTGAPLQIDLTANFMFQEKFILGGAYRWDAAASLMAGFQISKKLLIGYSYDMETTKLANYNSGSHEVFLRYELFKSSFNAINPRFF